MQNLLRFFLIFAAIYLIVDGIIHFLNIRLSSVLGIWPKSAIVYATLLNTIYASFVFLVAILILAAQKDLQKNKTLIFYSAIWALFHGFLLVNLALTQNFNTDLSDFPSLLVYLPFYNQYLLFEALLAFSYGILVYLWFKDSKK